MFAISASALSKRYGAHVVVNAVSFEVEAASIFGFLGPNGSGKTTTVRMLCGLVAPSGGAGSVCGLDPQHAGKIVRRRVGYMAQGFALYPDLTCDENLEFCARAHGLSGTRARQRKRFVFDITGIGRYAAMRAGCLSGGWQRRLGLAAALVHDPDVLFLDEPTAGVDPVARRELWNVFGELARDGKTFFVTTHDIDEAQRCARLGYMLDGSLLALGSVDDLRAESPTLEEGLVTLVRERTG